MEFMEISKSLKGNCHNRLGRPDMNNSALEFNKEHSPIAKRILIVVDEILGVKRFLKKVNDYHFDWEINQVDNVITALSTLGLRHFDFVVVDPYLRKYDNGSELLDFLRKNKIPHCYYAENSRIVTKKVKKSDTVVIQRGCIQDLIDYIGEKIYSNIDKNEDLNKTVKKFEMFKTVF